MRHHRTNLGEKHFLFSPINNEGEATELLITLSKGWYALGAMHMALGVLMIYTGAPLSTFTDGVAYAMAGYFLKERRSRTLAMIVLLYSLIIVVLTFGSFFGVYEGTGGRNVVLAILTVALAWRTDQAIHVYHNSIGSNVEWKNVAVVWTIVVVLSLATALLVSGVVMVLETAENTAGRTMMLTLFGLWAASFALLSKRFPFVVVDSGAKDADSDPAFL